jgi:hypothetical protein
MLSPSSSLKMEKHKKIKILWNADLPASPHGVTSQKNNSDNKLQDFWETLFRPQDTAWSRPIFRRWHNTSFSKQNFLNFFHQGSLMMEAVRTSETSVDNYFTRQYIPEDNSEHHTRHRENLKSQNFLNLLNRRKLCVSKWAAREVLGSADCTQVRFISCYYCLGVPQTAHRCSRANKYAVRLAIQHTS